MDFAVNTRDSGVCRIVVEARRAKGAIQFAGGRQ